MWAIGVSEADRWNTGCRDFVSGRAENLVLKVAKREDTRGGEKARRLGVVHLRRTSGRDREIS
jgi:hypothetical protein